MNDATNETKPRRRTVWTKDSHPAPSNPWTKENAPGGPYGTRALQRKFEGRAGDRAIQKLFRRKSIPVVHALCRIIIDPKAPASIRVAAAQLFLERGWGKMEPESGATAKKSARKKPERPIVVVSHVPRKNDGA